MRAEPTARNAFLAELSAPDYELFRPNLTDLTLNVGERLQDLGATIEQVIFLHSGLVAMTMPMRDGNDGGALLMGRDGICGAFEAAASAPATCDARVYIRGRAARMSASSFRDILDQSPTIRRLAARYNAVLMVQAHQAALCNAAHPVQKRVARSLLEVLDRHVGSDVPLTQVTLAQMLGVQRTTLNLAAGRLEQAGIINCGRGCIQIVRRDQLERHACECYSSIKGYVSRLFAAPAPAVLSATPGVKAREYVDRVDHSLGKRG